MTRSEDRSTVHIEDGERLLAAADVHPADEPGVVRSAMHVESGHVPPGTGARLVDAVLEHPEVDGAEHLVATMPTGDTEMIDRVRERSPDVRTRAAGATKIVEARLDQAD